MYVKKGFLVLLFVEFFKSVEIRLLKLLGIIFLKSKMTKNQFSLEQKKTAQ